MENFVYYNELFDIYETLLTNKEIETFKSYYQEDLSLAEIALNNNVSRSAIQKTIKTVIDKLNNYEDKLGIYKKNELLKNSLLEEDINTIKKIIEQVL